MFRIPRTLQMMVFCTLVTPLLAQARYLSDERRDAPAASEGPSQNLLDILRTERVGVRIHNLTRRTLLLVAESKETPGERTSLYRLDSNYCTHPSTEFFEGSEEVRFTLPGGAHMDLSADAPPHALAFTLLDAQGKTGQRLIFLDKIVDQKMHVTVISEVE